MAGGHSSNYTRGEMEVDAQRGTFGGFMSGTKIGGLAVAVIVLFPVLIFGAGMGWFSALVATFVFGILGGVVLKQGTAWYVTLFGLAVFALLACILLGFIT